LQCPIPHGATAHEMRSVATEAPGLEKTEQAVDKRVESLSNAPPPQLLSPAASTKQDLAEPAGEKGANEVSEM
jgi:hypothetical protein